MSPCCEVENLQILLGTLDTQRRLVISHTHEIGSVRATTLWQFTSSTEDVRESSLITPCSLYQPTTTSQPLTARRAYSGTSEANHLEFSTSPNRSRLDDIEEVVHCVSCSHVASSARIFGHSLSCKLPRGNILSYIAPPPRSHRESH